jgi:hypothetical protein
MRARRASGPEGATSQPKRPPEPNDPPGGPDERTGAGQEPDGASALRPHRARAHQPQGCLTLQWSGWDSGRSPGARGVENGSSGCGKEPRSLI